MTELSPTVRWRMGELRGGGRLPELRADPAMGSSDSSITNLPAPYLPPH